MINVEKFEEGEVHHFTDEQLLEQRIDAARVNTMELPDPQEGKDFFHLSPEQVTQEKLEQIEMQLAGELSEAERNNLEIEKGRLETILYQNKEAA
jgi:ABC-type phosphate transport system auxiliary subunit